MSKLKKPQTLRDQALACLARREHSRLELSHKLERAGHPAEDITLMLDEFEAMNWLSDHRFAESYVNDHCTKSGAIKLAYELRQRGITDEIIQKTLIIHCDTELERAREIWRKKFGTLPTNIQEKAKHIRFMQGRGFSLDVIQSLILTQ